MELEMNNVEIKVGDKLQIKGKILKEAERFQIDLGCDPEDLALHFNPRFHDDTDGSVLVCNSKIAGCWGAERRDSHNSLKRGSDIKVVLKLTGEMFKVELPDEHEVCFPNRNGITVINYVRVRGDFKLTSFKIC